MNNIMVMLAVSAVRLCSNIQSNVGRADISTHFTSDYIHIVKWCTLLTHVACLTGKATGDLKR